MKCKWFCNEPNENFSERPEFCVRSDWNPPNGYPTIEIFLWKFAKESIPISPGTPHDYDLSKEGWLAVRGLAEDHNIIIKSTGTWFCIAICDR